MAYFSFLSFKILTDTNPLNVLSEFPPLTYYCFNENEIILSIHYLFKKIICSLEASSGFLQFLISFLLLLFMGSSN